MLGFFRSFATLFTTGKGKLRVQDEQLTSTKPYVFRKFPVAYLEFESGGLSEIPLYSGFSVGRSPNCQLVLADLSASRVHASFAYQDQDWLIRDLASTNGTLVNGVRVSSSSLKPGDRIQIGQTVLFYKER